MTSSGGVPYRELALEARPYWPHIAALFGLGLLSSVFVLLTPLPLKIAVDAVVGSHPPPGFVAELLPAGAEGSDTGVLLFAASMFVLIAVLRQLQEFGNLVISTYAGEKMLLSFRSRLFRHAERLSLRYHDATGTADSTYRIQYDATAIQTIAITGLIPFFTATVTVVGMIYVTARIDWGLALVSLAVVPILYLALRLYRKRLRAQWHDAKRLESSAMSVVQESLEAVRVVKAFGREDYARDRFAARSGESMRVKIALSFVEGRFGIVIGATIGIGMAAVLFMGTQRVLAGAMTLGDLVLVMGYLQQLYDPLKTAAKKAGALQSSLVSAERVYSLLDQEPDFVDAPDARPLDRASGAVEFRHMSFTYEPGHPVLHDVSFALAPGTRLGIAGTTGAGKTTLVSLLTRFYDPSAGQILLDGVDLRQYRLADLRNQFAIVLQEPVLFSASIAENISYARPHAPHADIVAAAKAARAHDFIEGLPDGYDSAVGERGVRLSGGERQRISLARAFLKDAPILILDEPTSSVDARTEAQILDAMERLMRGRTTFLIAHRESTLAICDIRLQVEDGRVAAIGRRPRSQAPWPAPAGQLDHTDLVRVNGSDRTPPGPRRRRRRLPVACDPADHPAVRAWRTIAPARAGVERLDCLRAKEKLEIYRLGIANGGLGVIAKRRRIEALALERTIYESVLPRLPHPMLRYFGSAPDDDSEFAWIFIEDGGDTRCSLEQHARLVARWLATVHAAGAGVEQLPPLPDRGPDQYLAHLRAARATVLENISNPALGPADKELLAAIFASCDRIEESWNRVEALCRGLPQALVHGDLEARNLRLRRSAAGAAVVAFDWEWAGVGVAAADLSQLALHAAPDDLAHYRVTLSEHGVEIDGDALRALVFLGTGFRLLASVDWVSPHLRYPLPDRATATLQCYEPPLRSWARRIAEAA